MGEVYLGVDTRLDRQLTIKFLTLTLLTIAVLSTTLGPKLSASGASS